MVSLRHANGGLRFADGELLHTDGGLLFADGDLWHANGGLRFADGELRHADNVIARGQFAVRCMNSRYLKIRLVSHLSGGEQISRLVDRKPLPFLLQKNIDTRSQGFVIRGFEFTAKIKTKHNSKVFFPNLYINS